MDGPIVYPVVFCKSRGLYQKDKPKTHIPCFPAISGPSAYDRGEVEATHCLTSLDSRAAS